MMMEAVQEEVKTFSCKVCRESFPSGPALGGHMRRHFSGNLKRKTKSDFGKLEEEVAIALVALKMSGSKKSELLEIDIPESGAEEAATNYLSIEMWPKEREKIQVTDPAPEEKDKIVPSAKKRKMADRDVSLHDLKREKIQVTDLAPEEKDEIVPSAKKRKMADRDVLLHDLKREKIQVTDPAPEEKDKILPSAEKRKMVDRDVSLPNLNRAVYECNTCYRTFRSQQALGGHRSGWTRGRTCKKEEFESKAVPARFNLDGYILKGDVVWAKRRRSAKVFISYFVRN